jgi:hypothetical protein
LFFNHLHITVDYISLNKNPPGLLSQTKHRLGIAIDFVQRGRHGDARQKGALTLFFDEDTFIDSSLMAFLIVILLT